MTRHFIRLATMMLVAGTALFPAALRSMRSDSSVFVSPLETLQAHPLIQRDPTIARARYVSVNFSALPASGAPGTAPSIGAQFPIQLFDGETITAVFDHFDPNTGGGVTWVGKVDGVPFSNVTFAYGGGTMAGSINMPDRIFTIRPAPAVSGLTSAGPTAPIHVLAEINQAGFERDADPIPVNLSPTEIADAARAPMTDTADFIDVLILYTPAAAASAGATGIVNLVNLAVSDTNTAYANSGVSQRIRLVKSQLVQYSEVGNFSTNLSNLRSGLAGLEGVAALRDAVGADLVSLLIRPTAPDACGIAFLMTSVSTGFAPSGYDVTDTTCIAGYTLPHEFGHNMGLRHDWYVDGGITPFTYAHGHVDTSARFRTIMSYPDLCSALGFSCTRLLGFSNPSVIFNGAPTGIPGGTRSNCTVGNATPPQCDADEHLALNNTAFTVANFRQATALTTPIIVTQPQNVTLAANGSATLLVLATGADPLQYQWYRGVPPSTASPIPGANASALTVVPGLDGIWAERMNYWVRVSNTFGSADSSAARVTFTR